MQYALVNNIRREAFKGGKGACPTCGAEMIAKCGRRITHHWSHRHIKNCDPWWENETEWHRSWKNLYPTECREVTFSSPDGEIHRADIKTPSGIIIEFQNSAIDTDELFSREDFYKNLVWVVNGEKFKSNFHIYHALPDPKSEMAKDLVWFKSISSMAGTCGGIYWKRSENPEAREGQRDMVWVHGYHEISSEIRREYCGHHQYDWSRPRKVWLESKCPVYIDLGENYLVRLEKYGSSNLDCIRIVSKDLFLRDSLKKYSAHEIGTRKGALGECIINQKTKI